MAAAPFRTFSRRNNPRSAMQPHVSGALDGQARGPGRACTNWDRRRLNMNCGKKAMFSCSANEAGSSFR